MKFFKTKCTEDLVYRVIEDNSELYFKSFVRKTKIAKPTVKNFFYSNFRGNYTSIFHKSSYMRVYLFEYKKFLANLVINRRKFGCSLSSKQEDVPVETFFSLFYKIYHKSDIYYLFYALFLKITSYSPYRYNYNNSKSEFKNYANTYNTYRSLPQDVIQTRERINDLVVNLNNYITQIYQLTSLIKNTGMERLFNNLYGTYVFII